MVFAARYRYQDQVFYFANGSEIYTGDPFDTLPKGVEPRMDPRARWEIWRGALSDDWSDAQIDGYQYKHWCGAFSLVCLHDAELALDVFWKDGLGYVEPQKLTRVSTPEPGDIAFFDHNSHYAIVEKVRGNLFDSIDGNQGLTLAHPSIKLHTRELKSARAFYSISKLLGAT